MKQVMIINIKNVLEMMIKNDVMIKNKAMIIIIIIIIKNIIVNDTYNKRIR